MGHEFKAFNRDQSFLLPPSMRDWLPHGDLVYFLIDVVEELDLGGIYQYYRVEETDKGLRAKARSGQPGYHPKMMVALLLYAYCLGTPSSRKIARLCERDAGYRVVAGYQTPDFRTINNFRSVVMKEAVRAVFGTRGKTSSAVKPYRVVCKCLSVLTHY